MDQGSFALLIGQVVGNKAVYTSGEGELEGTLVSYGTQVNLAKPSRLEGYVTILLQDRNHKAFTFPLDSITVAGYQDRIQLQIHQEPTATITFFRS